jgi:secondary thiamine-phosphate synthase enzyme
MRVIHNELQFATEGHGQVIDLTDRLGEWLREIRGVEGQVTVFVPGSTGAVTTIEFESGCVRDLDEALERIAPSDRGYHHDQRWGDGNGFSHLRAALLGPSITVPVAVGRCVLGTWQQLVLVECDLRPRSRRVVFSFVGECDGNP